MPTHTLPSITVVIPAYKAEKTILRAVHSVLAQAGCTIHIIVVIDGDLDATGEILSKLGDPRVTVVTNPENKGVQFTRNRGLDLVTTDFVMFLDSDDFVEGPLLSSLAGKMVALEANLGLGAMQTLLERRAIRGGTTILNTDSPRAMFHEWLALNRFVSPCSVLWRTDYLREIGGWDPDLHRQEDGEVVLRAVLLGARITGSTEGRGVYVIYPSPNRLTQRNDNLDSLLKVPAKLLGIPSLVVPAEEVQSACAISYYNAARTCFTRGREDIGREALRRARQMGFEGHLGSPLRKLLNRTIGLRWSGKLERVVRFVVGRPGG